MGWERSVKSWLHLIRPFIIVRDSKQCPANRVSITSAFGIDSKIGLPFLKAPSTLYASTNVHPVFVYIAQWETEIPCFFQYHYHVYVHAKLDTPSLIFWPFFLPSSSSFLHITWIMPSISFTKLKQKPLLLITSILALVCIEWHNVLQFDLTIPIVVWLDYSIWWSMHAQGPQWRMVGHCISTLHYTWTLGGVFDWFSSPVQNGCKWLLSWNMCK